MLLKSKILYENLQRKYSRKINLDLTRIKKVLNKLGDPQTKIKNPINILGSDGKMSVLTTLKYLLEANDEKVTTFTSPHLYDVRSRIWLKNRYISLRDLKRFVKKVEKKRCKLTLFELLTSVYVLAASKQTNVTYNLCESGLLFRKDSTNLWNQPKAQIVTNINFQHKQWVNPQTINQICKEKVGSLSNRSTIYIAKQKPKVLKIIKSILKKNKSRKIYYGSWKIIRLNNKLYYIDHSNKILLKSKFVNSQGLWDNLGLGIKVALDLGVTKNVIKKTIPKIEFEGRVQYIKNGRLKRLLQPKEKLLVDGCHSSTSAQNLANYLKTIKKPIYGIWGMQPNRDPKKFIKCFRGMFKEIITLKIPNEPSSEKADRLKKIAKEVGFNAQIGKNTLEAIKYLSNNEEKLIVIFGSLYLVGNALRLNS
tara:strand:- start:226 stop:1491 length:1266 start_codon:yes stop_codon:yes gene_type:complete